MSKPIIRPIQLAELNRALFQQFERRQVIRQCWRETEGTWAICDAPSVDQWSEEDYAYLVQCLQGTLKNGGIVLGAFIDAVFKGFVSVEGTPVGIQGNQRDLTSLHVSEDMRGHGIGRLLFKQAAVWAKEQGAWALFISAHPAVETQAFYRAMGCVDADERMDSCLVTGDRPLNYIL